MGHKGIHIFPLVSRPAAAEAKSRLKSRKSLTLKGVANTRCMLFFAPLFIRVAIINECSHNGTVKQPVLCSAGLAGDDFGNKMGKFSPRLLGRQGI